MAEGFLKKLHELNIVVIDVEVDLDYARGTGLPVDFTSKAIET
jgi:hypothetical protein